MQRLAGVAPLQDANNIAGFKANVEPWIVRLPHPRFLLVLSSPTATVPLLAELTQLGIVVELASTAVMARQKYKYPGYHACIIVDHRGASDGTAISIAQDLRALAADHEAALGARQRNEQVSAFHVPVTHNRTILIGFCDTAEQRQKLATASTNAALSAVQSLLDAALLAREPPLFDLVLKYPLSVHLDFLSNTFISDEGLPTKAIKAPKPAELLRELNHVAGKRLTARHQQRLHEMIVTHASSEGAPPLSAAQLVSELASAKHDLTLARASVTEAEKETDVANAHARALRDERDESVERRVAAEAKLSALEFELSQYRAENTRLLAELHAFTSTVAERVKADADAALQAVRDFVFPGEPLPSSPKRSSPKRKPSPKRRRSPPASAAVQVDTDAVAYRVSQLTRDFALDLKFFSDELVRCRDLLHRSDSAKHRLEAENETHKLRFTRLQQYLLRTHLSAKELTSRRDDEDAFNVPAPQSPSAASFPSWVASGSAFSPTPLAGNRNAGLLARGFGFAGDHDEDHSKRQTLKDARLLRSVNRRASLSTVDPALFVPKDRHRRIVASLRGLLSRIEANAMKLAEAGSVSSRTTLLFDTAAADEREFVRRSLHTTHRRLETEVAEKLQPHASELFRLDDDALSAMPEPTRRVVTSDEHKALLDNIFDPLNEFVRRDAHDRRQEVYDLAMSIAAVVDDSVHLQLTRRTENSNAVAAALKQVADRVSFVLQDWLVAASKQASVTTDEYLASEKASARALEKFVVPIQASAFFRSHVADASVQTEECLLVAQVDEICRKVDAELRACASDNDHAATLGNLAASLATLTEFRPHPPAPALTTAESFASIGNRRNTSHFLGSLPAQTSQLLNSARRASISRVSSARTSRANTPADA
jgi:hypothetical protein